MIERFETQSDEALTTEFLRRGFVIHPVDDRSALDELREAVVEATAKQLNVPMPKDHAGFLNGVHEVLPVEKLNSVRLGVYGTMNGHSWFRPTYYGLARTALHALVGNELAMQNKVNLSIQFPEDPSSLLGVHSDIWAAESPFQVVVWLPLVDVFDTKSMYILDPETNRGVADSLRDIVASGESGSDKLFASYQDRFEWLSISYGEVLVFSPMLLHGNVINKTPETRWSMNCRFKGLFTPYSSDEKTLNGFYLPITTRVVSRIGANYRAPGGFSE